MSHSYGEVWTLDGKLVGHFEYNGTCDFARRWVRHTAQEVSDHWRADNDHACSCDAAGESVILHTDYGHGFYWRGVVCWNCMAIKSGEKPEDDSKGHPFFRARMEARHGQVPACPECGADALETPGHHAPIRCGKCLADFYEWNLVAEKVKPSPPDRA